VRPIQFESTTKGGDIMKKLGIIAATLAMCTGIAYASSLAVPWYVDTAPVANGVPGKAAGVTGSVILKSNRTDTVICTITYYSPEGDELGPYPPNNTFAIDPLSAISFRPVVTDPSTTPGGQESATGVLVPNRPRSVDNVTPIPGTNPPVIDTKRNGSITISWSGSDTDVQGIVTYFQTATDVNTGATVTMSYGTLLPPGV